MRWLQSAGLCSALALSLTGCGGSNDKDPDPDPSVSYSRMVNFGDSVSDVGTYAVSTIATVGGGKFTVNSDNEDNWLKHNTKHGKNVTSIT